MTKRQLLTATGILSLFILILSYSSCKKAEDIIEEDSKNMMSELQGKWNLVSVRDILLKSTNSGFTWDVISDDTIPATGEIDFASINGRDYTGSLTITYDTIDETHEVFGYVYKNSIDERVWINTMEETNIMAFHLFSEETSSNVLYLDDRGQERFTMWIMEINETYTRDKERFFMFERAK